MHNMNGKQQVLSDADLALVWQIQTIKASVIFSLFSCSCAESMSTLHPSTRVLWLFTVQGRSDFIHICSIYEREFFVSPKRAVLPLASLNTKPRRTLPELFSPQHLCASNEEAHMESTAHCLLWNLISWLLLLLPMLPARAFPRLTLQPHHHSSRASTKAWQASDELEGD